MVVVILIIIRLSLVNGFFCLSWPWLQKQCFAWMSGIFWYRLKSRSLGCKNVSETFKAVENMKRKFSLWSNAYGLVTGELVQMLVCWQWIRSRPLGTQISARRRPIDGFPTWGILSHRDRPPLWVFSSHRDQPFSISPVMSTSHRFNFYIKWNNPFFDPQRSYREAHDLLNSVGIVRKQAWIRTLAAEGHRDAWHVRVVMCRLRLGLKAPALAWL